VTILKLVWCSRRADAPRCAHFPTDICSVIQEGEITVEKWAHRGATARQERHTLSLGRNKHGHNNSAPIFCVMFAYIAMFIKRILGNEKKKRIEEKKFKSKRK